MTTLQDHRTVERPTSQVMAVFDGQVPAWLPATVGPEEGTWRVVTRESGLPVRLVAIIGGVWVLRDHTHRRRITLQPDLTSFADLILAMFTPRVEGHLRLESGTRPGTTTLHFEGVTTRRSWVTSRLLRWLLGDPLARSGVATLMDLIASRLATAPVLEARDQPRSAGRGDVAPHDRSPE